MKALGITFALLVVIGIVLDAARRIAREESADVFEKLYASKQMLAACKGT